MTEIEFLKARLDELQATAERTTGDRDWHVFPTSAYFGQIDSDDGGVASGDLADITHMATWSPVFALAQIAAQRKIIELHELWPVLIQSEPRFEHDMDSMTMRMSQEIAWQTTSSYRKTFGLEPPTGPIIRALIQPFAKHTDFQEAWRS